MTTILAEERVIGAYCQGVIERLDSVLFTGQRNAIVQIFNYRGRPASADVAAMWLAKSGIEYDIARWFVKSVTFDEADAFLDELKGVLFRRRCKEASERLSTIAQEGSAEPMTEVAELANWVTEPMLSTENAEDKTEVAYKWAKDHIYGREDVTGYWLKWSPLMGAVLGPRTSQQMIVVAGKQKSGKSAWTFRDALDAATQGCRVLYISPDMGERKCIIRMMAMLSGVSYMRLWRHTKEHPILSALEQARADAALEYLHSLPIVFSDENDVSKVFMEARRIKAGAVYLDFLGQFKAPGVPVQHLSQEMATAVTFWARRMANERYTCVISQVKTGSKPSAEGLAWTPELKNLCDGAIWIRQDDKNVSIRWAETVANRGAPGVVAYFMYGNTMWMEEIAVVTRGKGISL